MRITFALPHREKIQLTLRGPAPSCRTAGTVQIGGVRGDNRLDFLGRIRNRALRPGIYVLTLTSVSSHLPVAEPLLVQIVSPRRTVLLDDSPTPEAACRGNSQAQRATSTPEVALIAAPFKPPAQPLASAPARGTEPQRADGTGVLGVGLPGLPDPPALAQQGPWLLAVLLMLALLGVPLVALSALGVRFFRRRRLAEPS